MNSRLILHTASRVLQQLRHDRRSVALVMFVPTLLLVILNYVFYDNFALYNSVAPLLLGLVPFTIMFIITSVAMLRERTSGTLERLLVSKLSRLDIILGYAVAFALLAFLQSALASFVVLFLFNVVVAGDVAVLLLIAVISGITGMALGLFFSAFAKNEFQAVQFMPAFVLPQYLACGLFIARDQMVDALYYASNFMPLSYIVEAMRSIQLSESMTGELAKDMIILFSFTIVSLIAGALTLRTD
ncbi:TPA: ABC transporter permease [Candidatus Saccharibacteria bacterium]|nr:ABC transporter permease [Candidatus Saccharibacteria bacterium]HIO88013.1 ABC transporter permease [Candidatus Saccharibacteria bacterium]